jgi:hypothetical protein
VVRKLRILNRKTAVGLPNLLRGSKVEPSARVKAASRRQRGRNVSMTLEHLVS